MDKKEIIAEIKRTATKNKGKPFGQNLFEKTTGINISSWRGKYWRNWGDALEEAGFERNQLNQAYDDKDMIHCITLLTRKIKQFPTCDDIKIEKHTNKAFPGYDAIKRLGNPNKRLELVRKYATSKSEYSDILKLLPESKPITHDEYLKIPKTEKTDGFVYMVKEQYSKHFKIGKTFDIPRRHREIALELPGDLKKVHSIRTDDPSGIETYWHKRFADKRVKGEWFALTLDDIKAFKRRKFM